MKSEPAPTLERVKSHEMVRHLVDSGQERRPKILATRLREAGLAVPSLGTLRRWVSSATSPGSSLNDFDSSPSEELSFFAASWIGDGWQDTNDGGRRLLLKVRSQSFAEEFARAATRILKKDARPRHARRVTDKRGDWYVVKVTSLRLHEFVTRPLAEISKHLDPHPAGFLRGLFTAEGCPSINVNSRPLGASDKRQKLEVAVVVSNGDLELLQYARKLLAQTGFHPADARLNHPAGKVTNLSVATQDNHLVTLGRFGEMRTFQEKIGFADSEKNAKLEEAISLIDELGPFAAAEKWRELYVKAGGKWVRRIASRLAPHGDDSATLK